MHYSITTDAQNVVLQHGHKPTTIAATV